MPAHSANTQRSILPTTTRYFWWSPRTVMSSIVSRIGRGPFRRRRLFSAFTLGASTHSPHRVCVRYPKVLS